MSSGPIHFVCLLALFFGLVSLSLDASAGILLRGGVVQWLIVSPHVVKKNETLKIIAGTQTVRGNAPRQPQAFPSADVTL